MYMYMFVAVLQVQCVIYTVYSACVVVHVIVVLTYMIEYNVLVQCLPLDNEPIKLLCSKKCYYS